MKTKDLVYIGIIAYLAYLLSKKNAKSGETETSATNPSGTSKNLLGVTVGNGSNGGLNLGENMDLPSLTPTSPNGLSTEIALNSSNVKPIIKEENIPTQVFGNVTLPTPYTGGSVINNNPLDVVAPVVQAPNTPTIYLQETIQPTITKITTPTIEESSIGSSIINNNPIDVVPAVIPNSSIVPIPSTTISQTITAEPTITKVSENTIKGSSTVSEPSFPIKTIKAQLITNEPIAGTPIPLAKDVADDIISECGKSFSIPNNDKEGSYSNFWFDGKEYYTQTTSPLIKTIPTKISKLAYVDGCKRLQSFKMKNSKL
jgi:hypothetical protein